MNHVVMRQRALAELDALPETAGALVAFHARYKYVLMSCSPEKLRTLGRIVATVREQGAAAAIVAYREEFENATMQEPGAGQHVNTLHHIFGYFSKDLSAADRTMLPEMIGDYRAGTVPLGDILQLLRTWAVRFDQRYLADQVYLTPGGARDP